MRVAFASLKGKYLDCAFEECVSFSLFDFTAEGYRYLETLTLPETALREREEAGAVAARLRLLKGCRILMVSGIGSEAARRVSKAGIMLLETEPGAEVIGQLDKMRTMLKERPPLWLAKALVRSALEEGGEGT
ncbi:NifB/NifX family molybdenum-iron cluster-binding protein [Paenibacillus mesotrionivorans]|uniref:NifB/NifX family molybdenum-iron cluster-binding protein n=1 Tax=Paenibacillus mesotrionivorans TaxID=3160968 RepID=A0ACC7P040_9BACL